MTRIRYEIKSMSDCPKYGLDSTQSVLVAGNIRSEEVANAILEALSKRRPSSRYFIECVTLEVKAKRLTDKEYFVITEFTSDREDKRRLMRASSPRMAALGAESEERGASDASLILVYSGVGDFYFGTSPVFTRVLD